MIPETFDIKTKEDLVQFIRDLVISYDNEKDSKWESIELRDYLQTMRRWVDDVHESCIDDPDFTVWHSIAEVLRASATYE